MKEVAVEVRIENDLTPIFSSEIKNSISFRSSKIVDMQEQSRVRPLHANI